MFTNISVNKLENTNLQFPEQRVFRCKSNYFEFDLPAVKINLRNSPTSKIRFSRPNPDHAFSTSSRVNSHKHRLVVYWLCEEGLWAAKCTDTRCPSHKLFLCLTTTKTVVYQIACTQYIKSDWHQNSEETTECDDIEWERKRERGG